MLATREVIHTKIEIGSLSISKFNFECNARDKRYTNLAFKMVQDAIPAAGARIVALIAHRGEILSFGCNSAKTHPFQAKFRKNPYALFWHAETNAISNAIKRGYEDLLSKSSMYIIRLTNAGNPAISLPCEGCMKAIRTHKIPRVMYSTNCNDNSGSLIMDQLNFGNLY